MKTRAIIKKRRPLGHDAVKSYVPLKDRHDQYVVLFDQLAGDYGLRYSKAHTWRLISLGRFPRSLDNQGIMSFTHGQLVGYVQGLQKK